jgi:lipopolysaccharide export LptBFGC system permease protein LptF
MRRPGARLREVLAHVCDARTMERFVDPTIGDLQAEYQDAVTRGQRLESARIWIVGHMAIAQALALHGGLTAIETLRYLTGDDRRAVIRTLAASTAIILVGTLVLAMVPFVKLVSPNHPRFVELAFYLVPQALPLSIPIGLTFGILWALRQASPSRRARTTVLLMAFAASLVSFTMLAWVVPNSNQAFRVSMMGRPLPKGENELTIGELRQWLAGTRPPAVVVAPSSRPRLAVTYHARWSLAAAPFMLAVLAVAVTSRRRWGRMMPFLAGGLVIFAYYVILDSARGLGVSRTISPIAAAWMPNTALLLLSLAFTRFSSQRDPTSNAVS